MSPPKKQLMTRLHEEILWNKKLLSTESSMGLIQAVIFYLCKCFGVWHGKELRQIKTEHVIFGEDKLGKFVTIDLKSALGSGRMIKRYEDPNNPRSVYRIMKIYVGYLANDGPLIVRPISSIKDYIVYSPWPLGVNVIEQTVCNLMQESGCGSNFGNVSACLLAIDTMRNFGAGRHCISTWIQRLQPAYKVISKSILFRECSMINCEEKSEEACLVISHLLDPPYPDSAVPVKNINLKCISVQTSSEPDTIKSGRYVLSSNSKEKQQQHDMIPVGERRNSKKRSGKNLPLPDSSSERNQKICRSGNEKNAQCSGNSEASSPASQTFLLCTRSFKEQNKNCTAFQNSHKNCLQSTSHEEKRCTHVETVGNTQLREKDAINSSEDDDEESEFEIDLDDIQVSFDETVTGREEKDEGCCISGGSLPCTAEVKNMEKMHDALSLEDNFIANPEEPVSELQSRQTHVNDGNPSVLEGHKLHDFTEPCHSDSQVQDNFEPFRKILYSEPYIHTEKSIAVETSGYKVHTENSHAVETFGFINANDKCEPVKRSPLGKELSSENTLFNSKETGILSGITKQKLSSTSDVSFSFESKNSFLQNNAKSVDEKEMYSDHSSKVHKGRTGGDSNILNSKTTLNGKECFTSPDVSTELTCHSHTSEDQSSDMCEKNRDYETQNHPAWKIVRFLDTAHEQVQNFLSVSSPTSLKCQNVSSMSLGLPKMKIRSQKNSRSTHLLQLEENSHENVKLFHQKKEGVLSQVTTGHLQTIPSLPNATKANVEHSDVLYSVGNSVTEQSNLAADEEITDSCPRKHFRIAGREQRNLRAAKSLKNLGKHEESPLNQPCSLEYIGEMSDLQSMENKCNSVPNGIERHSDHLEEKFAWSKCPSQTCRTTNSTIQNLLVSNCVSCLGNSIESFSRDGAEPLSSSALDCVSESSDSCSGQYYYSSDHHNNVAYQSVKVTKEGDSQVFTIGDIPLKIPNNQTERDYTGQYISEINFGDYFPQNTVIPSQAMRLLTRQGVNGLEVILKIDHCIKQMEITGVGRMKEACL